MVGSANDRVYKYSMSGSYTGTSFELTGTNVNLGITNNDTYFWLVDPPKGTPIVYKYHFERCNSTTITAAEGSNIIIIYANDTDGNLNSSNVSFTVDTVNPTVAITEPFSIETSTQFYINYTANDTTLDLSLIHI